MSVKVQRIVNAAMIIVAWMTLPLIGKRQLKRFLPATIFIVLFEMINGMFGKKLGWWRFYNKPKSDLFGEYPFYTGPFLACSIWMLKWTYGNFKWFVSLNALFNFIFAFPIASLAKRIRYYKLERINHVQFFLYYFYKAFLLYGLQYLFDQNYSLKGQGKESESW
ncbi:hypothetical protein GWK91_16070 [Virgibacillus sp. MSP4-1]|uniref:hypothetical protein n=1 Tax=Virgibacillus sp. MSP4-1 TaxID=2700081 RepID=UPI0005C66FE9|nr:hypothetical protein [Virgibacillus sp. MSP4-1]QHS24316.1 hypothetical protein GWK91_16070 [Virgibacillus sp. MSP4-1]